jgi:hypothetical protein
MMIERCCCWIEGLCVRRRTEQRDDMEDSSKHWRDDWSPCEVAWEAAQCIMLRIVDDGNRGAQIRSVTNTCIGTPSSHGIYSRIRLISVSTQM